jgi:hypothetical protein
MQWTGLYDLDLLLHDAVRFLFARGSARSKLHLIRGVQRHLAELRHESKASYLAEHASDEKLIKQIFETWDTREMLEHLDQKSDMLGHIVTRLHDERLSTLVMFFTFVSVAAVAASLGQILYTPKAVVTSFDLAWALGSVATSLAIWTLYIFLNRR